MTKVLLLRGSGNATQAANGVYMPVWKQGEWRDLPDGVIRVLANGGYLFGIPEADSKESKHAPVTTKPVTYTERQLYLMYRARYAKEKRTEILSRRIWQDTNLTAQFNAAGYAEPSFKQNEIKTLPVSLVDHLLSHCTEFFSVSEGELTQFRAKQHAQPVYIEPTFPNLAAMKKNLKQLADEIKHFNDPLHPDELRELQDRYGQLEAAVNKEQERLDFEAAWLAECV